MIKDYFKTQPTFPPCDFYSVATLRFNHTVKGKGAWSSDHTVRHDPHVSYVTTLVTQDSSIHSLIHSFTHSCYSRKQHETHQRCISFLPCFSFWGHQIRSDQISPVAQSCPTLCHPMNCSTPGLPVHHQLPEFTQTHVHRVSDAIQPSHPLLSPSPPAPNPSQNQSLSQWVNSSHE